jgi:hypothetical protein
MHHQAALGSTEPHLLRICAHSPTRCASWEAPKNNLIAPRSHRGFDHRATPAGTSHSRSHLLVPAAQIWVRCFVLKSEIWRGPDFFFEVSSMALGDAVICSTTSESCRRARRILRKQLIWLRLRRTIGRGARPRSSAANSQIPAIHELPDSGSRQRGRTEAPSASARTGGSDDTITKSPPVGGARCVRDALLVWPTTPQQLNSLAFAAQNRALVVWPDRQLAGLFC